MNTYGFVKVAALSPHIQLAHVPYNVQAVAQALRTAQAQGAQLAVFPELCLTGATCGDLFTTDSLLQAAEDGLFALLERCRDLSLPAVVGLPLRCKGLVLNVALCFASGEILGIVPKTLLSDQGGKKESRWFAPASALRTEAIELRGRTYPCTSRLLFQAYMPSQAAHSPRPLCFGIEIGEEAYAPLPPHARLALAGAELICHPTAEPATLGQTQYHRAQVLARSQACHLAYLHAAAGSGESTTDAVYDGAAWVAQGGSLLARTPRFLPEDAAPEQRMALGEVDLQALRHARCQDPAFSAPLTTEESYWEVRAELGPTHPKLSRPLNPAPFVPEASERECRFEEILQIQTTALAARLEASHSTGAVVGVSGGLDSTLALLVTALAFDRLSRCRKEILGVTLPGFGTTDRTYRNAVELIRKLGLTFKEISIREACTQHFQDIAHPADLHNVVYENTQARERTQILMDLANQRNALVVGTGDLSELALGWATYNGDHMSMYGVNAGLPKTLIRPLVTWMAENKFQGEVALVLQDIVATPISPELLPADAAGHIAQKTEDLVGPYELHDFFLWHFMVHGASPSKIYFLACHAFAQSYTPEVIKHWLHTFFRRFFAQQFKRSCLPDGPQVCAVSLSPRAGWHMPSDAQARVWLDEIEKL